MKKLIYLFLLGLFSLNVSASLPIVKAIKHGDLDRVEQLVEEGADLNILIRRKYHEDYTETLLHRAIYEEQPEILQFLIEKFKERGISIDKMGTCNGSPLMYACSCGIPKYVKILIKNGADVNFNNDSGETSFMCAVDAWGKIENLLRCCHLLKKAGAKLSMTCDDLDNVRKYKETWPFVEKNLTLPCKLKYWLWRLLPDVDNSN